MNLFLSGFQIGDLKESSMAFGLEIGTLSITDTRCFRHIDSRQFELNYNEDRPLQHPSGTARIWEDYDISLANHTDFSNVSCYLISFVNKLAIYTDYSEFPGAKNTWVDLNNSTFTSGGIRYNGLGSVTTNNTWSSPNNTLGVMTGEPTAKSIGSNSTTSVRLIYYREDSVLWERLRVDTFILQE